jgi:hypothetical protein
MSWLQLPAGGRAGFLSLLVRQRRQPYAGKQGPSASLVRTDMLKAKRNMPSSLPASVPRWPMSALYFDGTRTVLLLRQEQLQEAMQGDGLRKRLELSGGLRRPDALRRAHVRKDLPCRPLRRLHGHGRCQVLLRSSRKADALLRARRSSAVL